MIKLFSISSSVSPSLRFINRVLIRNSSFDVAAASSVPKPYVKIIGISDMVGDKKKKKKKK